MKKEQEPKSPSLAESKLVTKRRWIRLFFIMLAAILATGSGCGLYAIHKMRDVLKESGYVESWEEGVDGESVLTISYGKNEWNKLDMYLPKELTQEKSHAAIVYVHGGSWIGGGRGDMRAFAQRAAKSGYVSASVDYLLCNKDNASEYSIFTVMDEIGAALTQLKATAAERGIELNRVALAGDSAGGHIVSLYAYSRGKTSPIPIAFIAPRVAPIDFHVDAWDPVQPSEAIAMLVSIMNRRSSMLTGKEVAEPDAETQKLIDAISPLSYLSAENTVPTCSAYGGKDPLVGVKHCAKLRARFKELGAKSLTEAPADEQAPIFDCIEFPRSGHMLERDPDCAKQYNALVMQYAERYLTDAALAQDGENAENDAQ